MSAKPKLKATIGKPVFTMPILSLVKKTVIEAPQRNVMTVFYANKKVVKINKAAYAERAVLHCIEHMQNNKYAAQAAEVFNEEDGTLYAVIRRTTHGVEILYSAQSTPDMLSFYLTKNGNK